jgi:hypothetical protein
MIIETDTIVADEVASAITGLDGVITVRTVPAV